jgi:hypothetical protein
MDKLNVFVYTYDVEKEIISTKLVPVKNDLTLRKNDAYKSLNSSSLQKCCQSLEEWEVIPQKSETLEK